MANNIPEIAKFLRYWSLASTTKAKSGHPTSCLSAADLMTMLFFGRSESGKAFFHYDLKNPKYENNDRLIFSKGHASPLFYALWAAAAQNSNAYPHPDPLPEGEGKIQRALNPEDLLTLRQFGSRLEGHPTLEFPFTEVPTGSLGQGLSVGVGMALSAQLDGLSYRIFVLLGDSEAAEGSVWEAMDSAAHYKLNNLVAILDCNRLGQRGETMYGHHTEIYEQKAKAFGWETIVIDGHNLEEIKTAYQQSVNSNQPFMIVAKTLKGKGVSFLEDKDNWHGKALSKEDLEKALAELGEVDKELYGLVEMPPKIESKKIKNQNDSVKVKITEYQTLSLNPSPSGGGAGVRVATRKAYGNILPSLAEAFTNLVILDAETSNSTYAETIKKIYPERFFEMFIAEQNMLGAALGLSKRGKIPFVSTFAAFLTRAFDQIRMSQYAGSNIKIIGSHAGVSIGEDGASQMALEDIAMFRAVQDMAVLYPSDAVSAEKLLALAAEHKGNAYFRMTRMETDIIYDLKNDDFMIGESKTLRTSNTDVATVIGAGVTLHEALKAYEILQKENINIRVIDLYSIKPLDSETVKKAAQETKHIITVEDHYPEGGIGEAVASELARIMNSEFRILNLAVRKIPKSGKPEELLAYEEIDSSAIVKAVKEAVSFKQ